LEIEIKVNQSNSTEFLFKLTVISNRTAAVEQAKYSDE